MILMQTFENKAMQPNQKKKVEKLVALCLTTIEKNKEHLKPKITDQQADLFGKFLLGHLYSNAISSYTYMLHAELCPHNIVLNPDIVKNVPNHTLQKNVREKAHFFEILPKLCNKSLLDFSEHRKDLYLTA